MNEQLVNFNDLYTLTRPTPKWVWNANRQLVEVPAGEPAYAHDPFTGEPLGLSIEPAATGILRSSRNLTGSGWTDYGEPISVTSGQLAPDGTNTAFLLAEANNNNRYYGTTAVSYDVGERYVISFWCYAVDSINSTGYRVYAPINGGSYISFDDQVELNKWKFVEISFEAEDALNLIQFYVRGSGYKLWWPQIEKGSIATSRIDVGNSAVTREADIPVIENVDTAPWFNKTEGTIHGSASVIVTGIDFSAVFHVPYTSPPSGLRLRRVGGDDQWQGQFGNAVTGDVTTIVNGQEVRFALSYGPGFVRLAINGSGLEGTGGTPTGTPTGDMHIGMSDNGHHPFDTLFSSLVVEKEAKSLADLEAMTL